MAEQDAAAASPADRAEGTRRWVGEHTPALVGLDLAAARTAVTEAGYLARVARPPGIVTADFRADRVTLQLDEHDRVREVAAG